MTINMLCVGCVDLNLKRPWVISRDISSAHRSIGTFCRTFTKCLYWKFFSDLHEWANITRGKRSSVFFKRAGCQKISKAPRNKWRWRCLQRKKKKRHLLKSSSALKWHKETGCYNICQLSLLGKFKKSSSLYFRVWIFLAGTTVLNKWNSVD